VNLKPSTVWVPPTLIAILLVIFFVFMPQKGFWGIDAGIKTLAAQQIAQNGLSNYSIPHPGKSIDPSDRFYPYGPPFVLDRNERQVSVFSPLYQSIASLFWRFGGESGIRFLSILGTLIAFLGITFLLDNSRRLPWNGSSEDESFLSEARQPKLQQQLVSMDLGKVSSLRTVDRDLGKVSSLRTVGRDLGFRSLLFPVLLLISTPVLFYSLVIWEHTLFVGCIVWTFFLINHNKKLLNVIAGLVLAFAVGLRPEGMLFLIGLLILYPKRIQFLLGGFGVLIYPILYLQSLSTGSLIPIQWTENLGLGQYTFDGFLVNFSVLLGFNDFFGIDGYFLVPIVLLLLFTAIKGLKYVRLATSLLLVFIYSYLVINRFISPTHPNLLASVTGILGCCPFIVLWWFFKSDSPFEKRLKWLMGGIITVSILVNPVAVGVHFGPRVLLPVIFIAAAFLLIKLPQLKNLYVKYLALFLLFISIAFQFQGLSQQLVLRQNNSDMRTAIAENVDSPLILSFWYHAGDLGPDIENYIALHPGNYNGWLSTLNSLKSNGYSSFWRLSREFSTPIQNLPVEPTGKEFKGKYWQLKEYKIPE